MLGGMKRCFSLLLTACLLSQAAGAYTVRAGDTLSSIARANATTITELIRINNLKSSALKIGQYLRVGEGILANTSSTTLNTTPNTTLNTTVAISPNPTLIPPSNTSRPDLPPHLPADQLAPTSISQIAGFTLAVPQSLRMGDAFVLRLSGPEASKVTLNFPSEVGEDVRMPNEVLMPQSLKMQDNATAGEYLVLGRVVLGKNTPLVYEAHLGEALIRGSIAVKNLDQPIQYLNLPPQISGLLKDPKRSAEDALVEKAYALRTTPIWTKPFSPALSKGKPSSSSFGQPRTYFTGGPVAYHYGTDYPAAVGTPVLAVNDGIVVIAGQYPVRGGLVVINHGGGLTSLYFHQSKMMVTVGQKVGRGQKIGEVGTTGLSAGPHLHLEMRIRGEATDAADWMNRLWPQPH